jgi:hypothetical protein
MMQYNGHLLTGQFALAWLVSRIDPLNYPLAVAPLLVMSFLAGVVMWRFLTALFGERSANLIPLAVFMLCPLSVPSVMWWAAALTIVPLQLFIVATLFAVLRYVRAPSGLRLAIVGLTYLGAVIFWEKAVLILPLVALFVVLYLGRGDGRERVRAVAIGLWRMWAVLVGITVPYTAWYLAVAKQEANGHPTALQIGRLLGTTMGSTIVPTYLGGPWSPATTGKALLFQLPLLPRVLTWLLAAAIVAASFVLRRQAWRAWLFLLSYIAMCTALVAVGRLTIIGPASGLGSRYFADSVAVFAIALGLAFMVPVDRRGDERWERRPVERRPVERGRLGTRLAVAVVLVYAVSALITSFRMAGIAHTFSAKAWLASVKSELATHPGADILDGYLPVGAAPPNIELALLSRALAPIAPRVHWTTAGETILSFDASGRLVPVAVRPIASLPAGPVPGCGYAVFGVPVTVPVRPPLVHRTWGIRIGYYTNATATGSIAVDGQVEHVTFERGLHGVTVIHVGTVTAVRIFSPRNPLCVGKIEVGNVSLVERVAPPGGTP